MKTYSFTLTGITPLLMHKDDVEASDELAEKRAEMKSSGEKGKAGDDRSPAWSWLTYVYHNGERVVMPSDNIMTCLRQAGADFIMEKNKTYKAETQTGLQILEEHCEFKGALGPPSWGNLLPLKEEADFKKHKDAVRSLGFDLFVKRAKVSNSKHVRVRPRFEVWNVRGTIQVSSPNIDKKLLTNLFERAGDRYGLCDWRPGCKTPGPYGRFEAKLKEAKA